MANLKVGVGGAWKQVQKVSVGVGGVWKDAWTYLTVSVAATLADSGQAISPGDATCSMTISSDGSMSSTDSDSMGGTWLTAGSASQVDVRLTQVSLSGGTGSMGNAALATWLNCGTSRVWTLTNTNNSFSTSTFVGTLEFRDATTLAVLDTATVTLEATVEV
jgi:hypothetical protein